MKTAFKTTALLLVLAATLSLICPTIASSCQPQCADNAVCNNGSCECYPNPPWTKGNGTFRCYNADQVAAEIRSDTTLTNYNNETVRFYLPCRYTFSHVRTMLRVDDHMIGNCTFLVRAFNAKFDGKLFAHGMDVAFDIRYANGIRKQISTTSWGTACDDNSNVNVLSEENTYSPDGPWNNPNTIDYIDDANGVYVRWKADNDVFIEAEQCGINISLVLYDVCMKINQTKTPGISMAVDERHLPVWLSHDVALALAPKSAVGGQTLEDILRPGLTEDQSMLKRALENAPSQNQPNENAQCNKNLFSTCETDEACQNAATGCTWMLETARFVRCIDGDGLSGGQAIMKMFNLCVEQICKGTSTACQAIKSTVTTAIAKCQLNDVDAVNRFLDMEC